MAYNLEKLNEELDTVQVAEALGLNPQRAGGGTFKITCPGHFRRLGRYDRHPSAVLFTNTPKGYYCFSCGTFVDVFDMVREVKECSLKEAFGFVADLFGGRSAYLTKSAATADKPLSTLTSRDIRALSLTTDISESGRPIVGHSAEEPYVTREQTYEKDGRGGYFICEKCSPWSYSRLEKESPDVWRNLIRERVNTLSTIYANGLRDMPTWGLSDDSALQIKTFYESRLAQLKEIKRKVGV